MEQCYYCPDGKYNLEFGATSVIGTSADKVTISDSGITLTENSVDSILLASGAVTLNGASTDDQVVINASGVTIKEGGTVRTTLAGNKRC